MTHVHVTTADSLHPYECDGPGQCIHCDQVVSETHDPGKCWLCHNGPPPEELREEEPV